MKTWGFKTIQVKKNERAMLLRNGDFDRMLMPGKHRIAAWGDELRAQAFNLEESAFTHSLSDYLMAREPQVVAEHFVRVQTGEDEVALLIEDGVLTAIIPPATRRLYWKGLHEVQAQVLPVPPDLRVPADLLARIRAARAAGMNRYAPLMAEVPQFHTGLLWVDGQIRETLPPGVHGWWQHGHAVRVDVVDLRAQTAEVAGQDILTRDKVTLRLNLTAVWRYTDAQTAFDKAAIDATVLAQVQPRLAGSGIALESVGVKDIILPGDMRTILAQVVEAEKAAQANVIRRREETAATRSLLNTAKVMEGNPVALRMKELETLERVAERIDKISVVGGLDQVLSGLVKLRQD